MSSSPAIPVPQTIPVMVLSNCTLFPHSLLPLFIFEPRYRQMLAHALENDRMFCLATLANDPKWDPGDESDERILPITTVGVVRACVGRPDGTSHLMLQGVSRVRITGWEQTHPFRIARAEVIPTISTNGHENQRAADNLLSIILEVLQGGGDGALKLATQLSSIKNPDVLADFVAANFLADVSDRQRALELADVGERLKFLLGCMGRVS